MVQCYIVYMIIGSLFTKATCTNKNMEQKMRHLYLIAGEKKQVQIESKCIRLIERELNNSISKAHCEQAVSVNFLGKEDRKVVAFYGEDFSLFVEPNGGDWPTFSYEYKSVPHMDDGRKCHARRWCKNIAI